MKKKLFSLLLAAVLTFSVATVAVVGASAALDENGAYVPSEGVEETHRYYFAMPQEWENEHTTAAGAYWWSGWDACGALDGSGGTTVWPGYKAQVAEGDVDNLFYMDISTDVPVIIWNNFLDGGEDTTQEIFTKAVQTVDQTASYYSEGDAELFDNLDDGMFFANMEESLLGDKEALGDFADNFFIDEEWGISFNFDNMIYIVNPDLTVAHPVHGKLTYGGEWHFYYGDGTYGPYPTKAASEAAGLLGDLNAPADDNNDDNTSTGDEAPTEPTPTTPDAGENTTVPAPGEDATSAVDGDSAATKDTADNTPIKTGAASLAVVLFVVLTAVCGGMVVVRRRYE